MVNSDTGRENEETRAAWNENAAFWDERMGEGNDFVNILIWPATERLLVPCPGERILDIACGNGLYARRLAALGAEVVAFDFAPEMIARAQAHAGEVNARVDYRVVDATDPAAILALGEGAFDAALCQMALFDMAEITPLFQTLPRLLRPGGRFVFSVIHPCFNNPYTTHLAEAQEEDGQIVTWHSVKVSRYMTAGTASAVAIVGQPKAQLIFHRPLQTLLGTAFAAGWVLDGLEERAFSPDHPAGRWWGGHLSEIPPVLVARLAWRGGSG